MKLMLNALPLLAVMLLFLAIGSYVFAQKAATNSSPARSTTPVAADSDWWLPRHESKLAERDARKNEIQLVMIGDSITHAWENEGKDVWEQHYAPREAFNLGYSGDRTEHVLWRLQHGEVEGLNPKLVVLMIGTNNAGHNKEPSTETAAGIRAILDELRGRLPASKILLLGIFPRDAQPQGKFRQLTDGTNELIKHFADGEHIHYLDIASVFLDDNKSLPESIMPDELHPNASGYKLWADAMNDKLTTLMDD